MKKTVYSKTIAAIATPQGEGGIAVIRISGNQAVQIASRIIKNGLKNLKERFAKVCVVDTGAVRDEVIVLYFKAPRSFTGEDVVEIQCHGGAFLAQRIVESLMENGAAAAEAGEFTRRAFLNGRIDLVKAEGILDIIRAKSESEVLAAFSQLRGGVSDVFIALQKELTALIASVSAALDYPEDDIIETALTQVLGGIDSLLQKLNKLKSSFAAGALLREGVRVTITGPVNAGKSLLLNRLLGYDRAIVSSEEGTTRDSLEESFLYKGVRFVLTDTAGMRGDAESEAERQGIIRAQESLNGAHIIAAVCEADKPFTQVLPPNKTVIYVKNKTDLFEYGKEGGNCGEDAEYKAQSQTVYTSALKNEGIDELKEKLYRAAFGKMSAKGAAINNLRQLSAVSKALDALQRAKTAATVTADCLLSDLNDAYRQLGSVTGITAADEIINEIFASFCVGK
ncbi:MAG: tRNA uridine-5-carboxymethylaminomethyl(34) synthesis GTPase MnmE [Firmicutes bacterium]|nr:tRNA uridine-5-carboxymethylaminomethyl(34) synthesis GTPase MnmE [Bacillota bacterium]